MTFQWSAVAGFLYGEIALLLLLCVPLISPVRWNKIFIIPIWNKIANYWNKAFLTIIVILIVLFLDAVREVRKYSNVHLNEDSTHSSSHSAFDHIHMKLFRSQRNLYISGFSLFLWLVLRRTVSLITLLAKEMEAEVALKTEVANSNEVARKCLEENEKLQQSLKKIKNSGEHSSGVTNEKLVQEVQQLKAELKKSTEALQKTANEITAVKRQSEELKKEYDLLLKEHEKLQHQTNEDANKKDR
ncbi:B-cell receptor-associated protein 29-like [Candoia aspera]|uniref:B-cell receptor-associated protein 29-like n=1 Tax=Candoia aspera TaxID=51853 RepID=UPI002FD7A378